MLATSKVRNVGISAHIDSGKTTLTERMLFYSGRIHRMQEVKGNDGGATMDFMDLERERGITITSAATQVRWGDHAINVIDTPGHVDFTVEVERSLRVLDGAILVLCAVGGVQSQSLTVDRQMKRYGVPRIAFINKMDRQGADFDDVVRQIEEQLDITPLPLQMPIGAGSEFRGLIDLIEMQAVYFDGANGENIRRDDIPSELMEDAQARRSQMLETLSLFSDDLMVALLEEREPPTEEVRELVRYVTLSQEVTPVLTGSAYKNIGVQEALDAVVAFLPSPEDRTISAMDWKNEDEDGNPGELTLESKPDGPMVGMAFKTVVESFGQLTFLRVYQGTLKRGSTYRNARTGQSARMGRLVRMHADEREDLDEAVAGDIIAVIGLDCASGDTFSDEQLHCSMEQIFVPEPVIRLSIEPMRRDGADRLGKALERFRREDPTFQVQTDPETNQTLIAGMGQLHLEVYIERIRREYRVECLVGEPRVAYRESPTKTVAYNYKHRKQTGGSGQYAHIVGSIGPLTETEDEDEGDATFQFEDNITGGRIPKEYIPSVQRGFEEALVKGPLCECPVVGVQATLDDGSFHEVDSSEMAFQICARNCMRETLQKTDIALLEPIMRLDVEVPDEFQGTITGHLASRRGIVSSMTNRLGTCTVIADVPLSEMFDYANELRSMTRGQGTFSLEFNCYRPMPRSLRDKVVEQRRAEKAERLAMAR